MGNSSFLGTIKTTGEVFWEPPISVKIMLGTELRLISHTHLETWGKMAKSH